MPSATVKCVEGARGLRRRAAAVPRREFAVLQACGQPIDRSQSIAASSIGAFLWQYRLSTRHRGKRVGSRVGTEKEYQKAIAIGEANQRTGELLRNWCGHLRIEKLGWGGLVEQMTGLPIGPRSLACSHATAGGFGGADLTFIALDFHDRNCAGCGHRKPVGYPNLSSLIHERDVAQTANDAAIAREVSAAAAAL